MKFTKMQGLGNDYVYVNCFEETVNDPEKLAIAVSDRHFETYISRWDTICPIDFRLRYSPKILKPTKNQNGDKKIKNNTRRDFFTLF